MILEVEAVDTFYGETQALFGASLAVDRGKVFALLGPNGAGKTTMLRSILGLTRPRRGAIRFDGREVTHSPTHEIARGGIGWVPDDRRISFFRGYLGAVAKAHKEGVPIRAYHAWSLMDNYEWSEGYSQRFGFVFVDFRTLKRTVKQSGKWYAQLAATGKLS